MTGGEDRDGLGAGGLPKTLPEPASGHPAPWDRVRAKLLHFRLPD